MRLFTVTLTSGVPVTFSGYIAYILNNCGFAQTNHRLLFPKMLPLKLTTGSWQKKTEPDIACIILICKSSQQKSLKVIKLRRYLCTLCARFLKIFKSKCL